MIWQPFTIQNQFTSSIEIVKGSAEFLYDQNGKEYIDAISSWWALIHGHNHPKIMNAIQEQIKQLDHVILAGFTHPTANELARKILALTNHKFCKIIYSDNGSTAMEIAVKLAFQYFQNKGLTSKTEFIHFQNSYHGDTMGNMSIGGDTLFNRIFKNLLFKSKEFPSPRKKYKNETSNIEEILELFRAYVQKNHSGIAGVVIEPLIMAAGGMVFHEPDFLNQVSRICRKFEILLIFDEVFTGFGRTGSMFAYEQAETIPDILAIAKGFSGGVLPLAGTLVNEKIYEEFYSEDPAKCFYHGHTMSGNPIACSAAIASLDILINDQSLEKVSRLEILTRNYSEEMVNKYPNKIEEVRTLGACSVIEIKSEAKNSGYNFPWVDHIKKMALENGVVLRPLGNILYVTPPYVTSEESIQKIFEVIEKIIKSLP